MNINNLGGFLLNEAIEILEKQNYEVKVIYTNGLNRKFNENLSEPRVIKITQDENQIILFASKF